MGFKWDLGRLRVGEEGSRVGLAGLGRVQMKVGVLACLFT